MGATLSSETTAAATGAVGVVRRDPMAMLPFLGYAARRLLRALASDGRRAPEGVPAIFYVNWFRRSPAGDFLWPGFGENSRVLKWIVERLEGRAQAVETPVGSVPLPASLDVGGLNLPPEALEAVLTVNAEEWRAELALIEDWFAKLGPRLPAALHTELDSLTDRLGSDFGETIFVVSARDQRSVPTACSSPVKSDRPGTNGQDRRCDEAKARHVGSARATMVATNAARRAPAVLAGTSLKT
jgi:hypothetical protein